jgi:hypothetical protein
MIAGAVPGWEAQQTEEEEECCCGHSGMLHMSCMVAARLCKSALSSY